MDPFTLVTKGKVVDALHVHVTNPGRLWYFVEPAKSLKVDDRALLFDVLNAYVHELAKLLPFQDWPKISIDSSSPETWERYLERVLQFLLADCALDDATEQLVKSLQDGAGDSRLGIGNIARMCHAWSLVIDLEADIKEAYALRQSEGDACGISLETIERSRRDYELAREKARSNPAAVAFDNASRLLVNREVS